eukprot:s137_g22.t1
MLNYAELIFHARMFPAEIFAGLACCQYLENQGAWRHERWVKFGEVQAKMLNPVVHRAGLRIATLQGDWGLWVLLMVVLWHLTRKAGTDAATGRIALMAQCHAMLLSGRLPHREWRFQGRHIHLSSTQPEPPSWLQLGEPPVT